MVISFLQRNRYISITYHHTPIHRTVAQLKQHFPPPVRQPGPGAPTHKTSKKSKSSKRSRNAANLDEPEGVEGDQDGNGGGRKKRKREKKAQDENGNPRRKKKKMTDEAAAAQSLTTAELTPSTGALEGRPQTGIATIQNGAQSGAGTGADGAHVTAGADNTTSQAATSLFSIKLTPHEANRRKDVALSLLRDSGIDPDTLSDDQFNIFSNQSPENQKESVAMLVKYGAERLRIIPPSNKDNAASGSQNSGASTPAVGNGSPGTANATPSTPAGKGLPSPKKKGSRSNDKSESAKAKKGNVSDETPTSKKPRSHKASSTPEVTRGGKARVGWPRCLDHKLKRSREKPTCPDCLALAPQDKIIAFDQQKSGVPAPETAAAVSQADNTADDASDNDDEQDETQVEEDDEQASSEQDPTDYSSYPQLPVANMLATNQENQATSADSQQTSFFQSASQLPLPQPTMPTFPQQTVTTASGLVLPYGQLYGQNHNHGATSASPVVAPEPQRHVPSPAPPIEAPAPSQQRQLGSRSSLPAGRGRGDQTTRSPHTHLSNPTPAWSGQAAEPARQDTSTSSTTSRQPHQTHASQRSSGSNQRMSTASPQLQETLAAATTLSQAAIQQRRQTQSPSVVAAMQARARSSPFQMADAARSSRQGHETQKPAQEPPMSGGFQNSGAMSYYDSGYSNSNPSATEPHGLSTYDSYERSSNPKASTNAQSLNHITYEPFSNQNSTRTASPYTAYDYSHATSQATSMASRTATTMAPSSFSQSTQSNQWMDSSGNRDVGSQYQGGTGYNSTPYSQQISSTAQQEYSMRGGDSSSSQQDHRGQQHQQPQQQQPSQPYSSYAASQPRNQTSHQTGQRTQTRVHQQQRQQQQQRQSGGQQHKSTTNSNWYGGYGNSSSNSGLRYG